jgi:hypothetical protein
MVEEFLMMWLVDLLVDIPVWVDIHHFLDHPILYCTCHCQSLVDQSSGHIVLAMMEVDLLVRGILGIQEHLVDLLHILHVLVGVVLGDMRVDSLVLVDHPFLK